MVISELIEKLKTMQSVHGDARVEVRNEAGDWDDAEEIQATYYDNPFYGDPFCVAPKWVVFIGV